MDMAVGRWYPSLIMLGDGRVVAVAGLTKHFPWAFLRKLEIYTPGLGWRKLENADRWMPLYPRLHLLPDGDIFYAGSYNTHYTFPFTLRGFPTGTLNVNTGKWTNIGLPNHSEREEGSTVLLPLRPPYRARVMLMGGGETMGVNAVPDVEIIDLSGPKREWKKVKPMLHARYYCYPVILPDGRVFVMGGKSGEKGHGGGHDGDHDGGHDRHHPTAVDVPQNPQAIRTTEIYDDATGEWTHAADMMVDRLYHANALLLPDGRVLMAGSNPQSGVDELRFEIYQPSYLFKGPRPEIDRIPSSVTYSQEFDVETPYAADIDEVVLIHPIATTHCFSTEQRYVGLAITSRTTSKVTVKMPDNCNVAPPGYYMLFIVSRGIPSEAQFVLVG
jgi:hypothetical protein